MSYCKKCRVVHKEVEFCPNLQQQLKENPQLLADAANFTMIAGQYQLATSQTLDSVAQAVNKLTGTNLTFEGTHQLTRDIQVFNQMNIDPFSKSGVFSSAYDAKAYFDSATEGQVSNLARKLNGTGQEVDWLRMKQGELNSLFEKSKLLGEEVSNMPGVDGATLNRFTGEEISRTTIKAAEGTNGLGTNVSDILKALEKGKLNPKDVVVGIEGTESALEKALEKNIEKALLEGNTDYAETLKTAREHMRVEELNTTESVKESTTRLMDKIEQGQAHTQVTLEQVGQKALQGAVIGAAIGLTISSVTNYLKYRNGEITKEEAFRDISQGTVKSSMIGATTSALTLFMPAGAIGIVGGIAVGIYLNKALSNVLDEIYGKGAFEAILHSNGYVSGMAVSLQDSLKKIKRDHKKIEQHRGQVRKIQQQIKNNVNEFDQLINRGKRR